MLAIARERAVEAGLDLELHEADMRDLDFEDASDLVICPYRALLHLPTWADRRRVFERVARALRPGGRFAWNAFVFDHRFAAEADGKWSDEPLRHLTTYAPGDNRVDITLEDGPDAVAVVGHALRVGRAARRRRPRDGGALRLVRPPAVRRLEPRVRLGRAQAVVALYDEIASFYDPWSRSVTEDVAFYVDEALASGGPVVELAVGTGRIAIPIAQAGIDVIGVDSSPGMLAVARAAADEAEVSEPRRPPSRRSPRPSRRRARPPRHLPVSLAAAHGDRGREAARAPRGP